jgi:acyl-homoserine lactone acylase PvdQ
MLWTRCLWSKRDRGRGDGSVRPRTLGLLACAVLAALACIAPASASAAQDDFSGPAYQILPPGNGGVSPIELATGKLSLENCCEQSFLYSALTPLQGNVTTADLENLYLSEKFGVTGPVASEEHPEAGLVIKYDKNGIPHVYGLTRADVMFGSGWIASKERGLLLYLGLGPAYAAAVGAPTINAFGLLLTGRSFTPSAQSEAFVAGQRKVLEEQGPKGKQVYQDLENWADGVNAQQESLGPYRYLKPVTATDAIAGFSYIGAIFGNGGGSEVADSEFLGALEQKLGAKEGLEVFRDLRQVNDPEAQTTAAQPFPYDQVPTGATPGALVVEPGSASPEAVAAMSATRALRRKASNFLLAAGELSADGQPLAVMGPQLGYYFPEIVMQGELQGGGISAQGVIAPIAPYVFIGRGRDYAWSLTSADSENVQQFLEQLCNPNGSPPTRASTHYVYNGKCVAMTEFDAGTLGPFGSEPEEEVKFMETVHGPVSGTVMVHGEPYAIANDRTTRGREPVGEISFSDFDSNAIHSPSDFFKVANELETTFNISYVDSNNIAYFSAGRLPVLANGTDPSLPTLGTGQYDWKGFLNESQHPHETAPKGGVFLNWNNKPAPEWGAASDNWSEGAVQRVELFDELGTKKSMNEASVVSVMNKAATEDLPAVKDWPLIQKVLEGGPAPSKLAQEAANLVTKWVGEGASRLGEEQPSNPGAAVLDAAWYGIASAVLSPVLGNELTEKFAQLNPPENAPSSSGSAYGSGWYSYVNKDLREELGLPVKAAYSRRYCGNGSLSACRTLLWAAIKTAAEKLEGEQGSNPNNWRAARVRIEFPPIGTQIPGFPTMEWTNRSTFQQVIQFVGAVKVISSSLSGSLVVKSGESVELTSTGKISGAVSVEEGGELSVQGGSISGSLKANGAAAIRLCGAMVSGSGVAMNASGSVVIGEGTSGCAANSITGAVTITNNKEGVVIDGNTINGSLSVTGNEGGTTVINNSVSGSLTVTGNEAPVIDKPNKVSGSSTLQ